MWISFFLSFLEWVFVGGWLLGGTGGGEGDLKLMMMMG